MFGSLPVFCDEVLVDKAEVPGPLGEICSVKYNNKE